MIEQRPVVRDDLSGRCLVVAVGSTPRAVDAMSETSRDLLREALTAKLAVEIGRPHRATLAAGHAGRLASQLVEELAGARAREDQRRDDEDDLADLLAERYPTLAEGDDP